MPRGRKAEGGASPPQSLRKSTRRGRPDDDVVPAVYQELLIEAAKSTPTRSNLEGRPVKRRRVGERTITGKALESEQEPSEFYESEKNVEDGLDDLFEDADLNKPQQTIYEDLSDSDDEDFEDVDLEGPAETEQKSAQRGDLSISLQPVKPEKASVTARRKPVSAAERRFRLDVHKMHVLCLLAHAKCRSDWSNDPEVQSTLKPLLTRKTISLLHVDESQPQYQRNHSWNVGIAECCSIWKDHFEVSAYGLRRAWWRDDAEQGFSSSITEDSEYLVDKDDFKAAAHTGAGSRDVGAQLLCALLRSVAVDARIVFSLQPLPFSGVAKGMTPEKPKPDYILATNLQRQPSPEDANDTDDSADLSNPRRRLGQPQFTPHTDHSSAPARPPPKKRRIVDSPFPIFWVEALNDASQKWIPLDPIVRNTFNKPKTGFEPPASDRLNNMSYVIAFEEDGTARDVTRRYARHYNAKTRKSRVDSTKGGEAWWNQTMSFFTKLFTEDRDDIEDEELAAREAAEEMPRNVQDFKDHPHYALERHLRRNEAIYPMKEVGKVSPGMGKDAKLESIYRRRDVHVVRSADQWYRKGRDVKLGEQPLKRAMPRPKRLETADDMDDADDEVQDGTRLYAEFQTELYVPPPIVNGRVPKNAYSNIDVYVPSMIPPGGIHLRHLEAARAARTLGIDYADAVTGFEFRGRKGTAVVQGIVSSLEYKEALVEVLRAFNDERAKAIEQAKTIQVLTLWKKFLVGLRVKERVKEYEEDDTGTPQVDDDDLEDEDAGGGFFHEAGGGFVVEPTIREDEKPIRVFSAANVVRHLPVRGLAPASSGSAAIDDLEANIIIEESPHTVGISTNTDSDSATQHLQASLPPSFSRLTTQERYDIQIKPRTETTFQQAPMPDMTTTDIKSTHKLPTNPDLDAPVTDTAQPDETMAGGFLTTDETPEQKQPPGPGNDSEIEKGSLISEDPEDEDADPEWLVEGSD